MKIRIGGASAVLAVLLAAASTVPAHADEHTAPAGSHRTVSTRDVHGFLTKGDYAHFSHTVRNTVNAHGWWKKLDGPATHAKITIWLQVETSRGWRTLDKGVKTVPSGGGSNKRAVANWKCTNLIVKNHFRTVVDADIVGYPDGPEKLVTKTQTLYCGV
ncbi:hypothetical protein OHA45_11375 [Streptomyces lydicus]|uniref:hypothetical protein n=1 Tax=Streptomyces lydicus TaxID=47763 RepID=UPI002E38053F|nr:hypothetical protein [Streptomyces lydicus]